MILAAAGLLSLALGFALRPWFSGRSASAAELPLPAETVATLPPSPTGATEPDGALPVDPGLIQEANGIQVSIDQMRREKDEVRLDVCYEFPSALDWTMWDAHLEDGLNGNIAWDRGEPILIREPPVDGKQKVTPYEETQIGVKLGETHWEDAGDATMGLRCDRLHFSGVPAEATHFTFTLAAIAAYPREGEECSADYLATYQAALDARETGIVVDCRHEEFIGGLRVVDKPASMSEEAAENMLHSEDLFLDLRGIRGPWVFEFELPQAADSPPPDLSRLGTQDNPTIDPAVLRDVLAQIEAIPPFSGPGWVHLQYTGTHAPPDAPQPLHPQDGTLVMDEWFYVNSAGMVEKSLQTSADRQGNVLQECACAEEICGNISKAGLAEFDDLSLSQPFQPYPYSQNSSSAQLREVDAPGAEIRGWVAEGQYGAVVYVSSYHRNGAEQLKVIPEFEGSRVTLGVLAGSGLLAHYSLYEKVGAEERVNSLDELTRYEILAANPEVDRQIAGVVAALKARDGGG